MGWNEPEDGNRDPWGGRRNDQGPPDLDEVIRRLRERLGALFGGRGRRGGGAERPSSPAPASTLALVAVLALTGLLYEMFWRIDSAERGVVLRFGKYVTTLQPGPHFRLPRPFERVIKINVDQIRGFTVNASMLTKDENITQLELAVQYRIKDEFKYLLRIADPDQTVQRAAESAIRETIGGNTFDFVINEGRAQVGADAGRLMQDMLDNYESGIEITSVNMLSATAPEDVKSSFDDAIKSREDKQRKINEAEAYRNEIVERAQGEASRIRLEAEAYKAEVVSRADGEARRFEELLAAYDKAPAVTRQRLYLETVESVLGNTGKLLMEQGGGNNVTYLPLDRLLERKPSAGAGAAAEPAANAATSAAAVADPDVYPERGEALSRLRESSRLRGTR